MANVILNCVLDLINIVTLVLALQDFPSQALLEDKEAFTAVLASVLFVHHTVSGCLLSSMAPPLCSRNHMPTACQRQTE